MTRTLADGPTRFGVFLPPLHKMGISPTVHFERDLELIERADRLGFQEFWIGEHHTGGHEPIGSPELFLAAASQRTKNIMLGTGVNSLPYHNPFTLASRLTLLDHLSHGRAIMGFGPGQLASDAHLLGIDSTKQRAMMLEAAEVIVRLMNGEWVTHESDWFTLRDAHLQVLPYQLPSLEMVVAAVASPSGPVTAGRLGLGMLNLAATTPAAFDALRDHWSIAEEEATRNGVTVTRERWRLSAFTHIAETVEQARKDCEYGFMEIWTYLGALAPLPQSHATNTSDMLDEAIDAGLVVVGTPDTMIETIDRCVKQSGGFGTWVMSLPDFAPPAARVKALELAAEHVIPHYRGHLKQLNDSRAWVLGKRDSDGTSTWKTQTVEAISQATRDYQTTRRT
ncbi:LLM class flavin-dependent oxidoreductase [Kribbella sp. NBC_00359]|uniref:LLM class flavin-dependent oxidoreductase n=1 Tax=Kribbella sp. NBC_00359 TaxID=2975966 RepID=UPI002E1AD54C